MAALFWLLFRIRRSSGRGEQGAEGNAEKGKKREGRVVIQNHGQGTYKAEGINDEIGKPVENSIGNIGGVGTPASHQIAVW